MTLTTAAGKVPSGSAYVERIHAYVDEAKRRDIRVTECITDAKGNRSLPPGKQEDPDVYTHIVDRSGDGGTS